MKDKLIIVEPGTLSDGDIGKLSKEGFTVIEHADPEKVRIVSLVGNTDLQLAMKAMANGISRGNDSSTKAFVGAELAKSILEFYEIKAK